jgi:hypothetical protein
MNYPKIAPLLCAAAMLSSSAQAATLHVPAEYPTIQAGIDAAAFARVLGNTRARHMRRVPFAKLDSGVLGGVCLPAAIPI